VPFETGKSLGFDRVAFDQSRRLFDVASLRLPEDKVRNLAQEVVARLAERVQRDGRIRAELPAAAEVDRFCDALVSDRDHAAADIILKLRLDGTSVETVYLDYIARAAELLGNRWEEDRVSFVQMTVAAGRMLGILRGLRHVVAPRRGLAERSAFFATVPGEDHVIGVTMAADLLRREGWAIRLMVGLDHGELVQAMQETDRAIIGLAASTADRLADLAQLVVAARISHPDVPIMIGGRIGLEEPGIDALVGADGMATDLDQTLAEMERLFEQGRGPQTGADQAGPGGQGQMS